MATGADHRVGRVLGGRYALGPVIGRGGMGQVHRAHDERLDRAVAIKVLRVDLRSPADRARFEREALAAARVAHPNVIAIYDVGEQEDDGYIVMECLPGQTLADELARGPLPSDRIGRLAVELLGALQAAHRQGVLHRDLKPGNVLFSRDGAAKLGDFGIAKLRDEADLTEVGAIIGTARYMASERLRGEPATEAADLYAVGVLLYEAVTGCRPFEGDSPAAVAHAIATTTPRPVRLLRPDCDPHLARAIERAMAKDPVARFADAAAMLAALSGAPTAPAPPTATTPTATAPWPTTAPATNAAAASAPTATAIWPTASPAADTTIADTAADATAVAPTVVAATAGSPATVAIDAVAPAVPAPPTTAAPSGVAPRRSVTHSPRLLLALLLAFLLVAALVVLAARRGLGAPDGSPSTTAVTGGSPASAPSGTAPTTPVTTAAPALATTTSTTPPSSQAPAPAPAPGKGKGKDKKG